MDDTELSSRLDRIETALITLARVEERQVGQATALEGIVKSQDGIYERLRVVENILIENKTKISVGKWVLGAVGTATLALLAWFMKGGGHG